MNRQFSTVKILTTQASKFAEKGAEVPLDVSEASFYGISGIDELRRGDNVLVHYAMTMRVLSFNGATATGAADTSFQAQQIAVHR